MHVYVYVRVHMCVCVMTEVVCVYIHIFIQTMPCALMAVATFTKPAALAPKT